jgi:drug/metabolite transporter (DMT)-like permease
LPPPRCSSAWSRRVRCLGLTFTELKAGMLIGVAIMLGYGLQTMGLQTISSSQSAFITALYVPFVPLLQWLVLGRRPGLMPSIGICWRSPA